MIELGWHKAIDDFQINGTTILKGMEILVRAVHVDIDMSRSYVILSLNKYNEYRQEIKPFLRYFIKIEDEIKPMKRVRKYGSTL